MTSLPQPHDTPGDRPALHLVTDLPDEAVAPAPEQGDIEREDWVSDPAQLAEVIRTPAVVQVTTKTVIPAYEPPPLHERSKMTVTYFATGLAVLGDLAFGVIAWLRPETPFYVIAWSVSLWTICALLLMCAEMVPRLMENQDIDHARQAKAIADAR